MPEKLKHHSIPGGPARVRPIYHDGVYYDPLHPPKIVYSRHGDAELLGGKRLTRDEANSMLFWARKQPKNMKDFMIESLEKAHEAGVFASFVGFDTSSDTPALLQESDEKLAAYRILAEEMGLRLGAFHFNTTVGTATAPVVPAQEA